MSAFIQISIAVAVAIGVLLIWNIMLEFRLRRLTRGSDGKNLERHLGTIARDYQDLEQFKSSVHAELTQLDARVKTSVRGVGIVRFNPFAGNGDSKPSFAAAFVAEDGTGIVISTLHARSSVSIFSKNIVDFKAEQMLTEEESAALEKARKSLHT